VREPLIAAWKARHTSVSGHRGKYAMREILNALRYRNRTGCQGQLLSRDLPPTGAVRYYFDLLLSGSSFMSCSGCCVGDFRLVEEGDDACGEFLEAV
jgi:transposase